VSEIEKTAEELEQEAKDKSELEAKEAEEGFAAGYKTAHGSSDPSADVLSEKKLEAEPEALPADENPKEDAPVVEAAAEEAPVVDEWEGVHPKVRQYLEGITSQVEGVGREAKAATGRVAAIQSAIDTGKAAATKKGADEPTEAQVAQALSDTESWTEFESEFPDFAKPIKAQLGAIRSEIAKVKAPSIDTEAVKKTLTEGVDTRIDRGIDIAEERVMLRLKHPNWRSEVAKPEFNAWANAQPEEIKALRASYKSEDAIKLIDGWVAHNKKATASVEKRKENERRLRGALPPTGTPLVPQTGTSDDDAFARGYKRARGS